MKNKHHMLWQLSEVKVQTAGIQSEKIWTPYRQSTHPNSCQLKWTQCSLFFLSLLLFFNFNLKLKINLLSYRANTTLQDYFLHDPRISKWQRAQKYKSKQRGCRIFWWLLSVACPWWCFIMVIVDFLRKKSCRHGRLPTA